MKTDSQIKAITWMPGGIAIGALTTKNNQSFTMEIWDAKKREENLLPTNTALTTIAWCPAATSNLIATGSKDGRVLIWKYASSYVPASLNSGLKAEVISLAWSADGQWLAAGYNDKDASIVVWKIQGRGF